LTRKASKTRTVPWERAMTREPCQRDSHGTPIGQVNP
jgi:hypothetical protein